MGERTSSLGDDEQRCTTMPRRLSRFEVPRDEEIRHDADAVYDRARMRRRHGPRTLSTLAMVLTVSAASAISFAADGRGITLRAPAECPADALRGRVAPTSEVLLDVEIIGAPGGFVGRLVSKDVDGVTSVREVSADTCAEVVDALSLLIDVALGLEPAPRADTATRPAPPEAPPVTRAPSVWELGAGLSTRGLLGRFPAPSATLFVADSPSGRLGFSARAGLTVSVGGDSIAGGAVAFDLAAAELSGCGPFWVIGALGLRPCASGQLGYLTARGRGGSYVGESEGVLWATGAVSGEVSWPANSRVRGTLTGGARASLLRHRFFFAPDTTVYRMPMLGGEIGTFVTLEIP